MHPEHENFDSLRRLLVLKRHEQPPPGYFQDFSGHVLARIRAGERVDRSSFWESLSWEAPWLQRLWASFETKPIMAGALGMIVCGFLVSGVLLSDRAGRAVAILTPTQTEGQPPTEIAIKSNPTPPGMNNTIGVAPEQSSSALFDGMKLPGQLIGSWPAPNGN